MASEGRILNGEEVGKPKPGDHERAADLLKALEKEGRLDILRDIAKIRGATLRLTVDSERSTSSLDRLKGKQLISTKRQAYYE